MVVNFNPVAFWCFDMPVRWYGIAYGLGLWIAFRLAFWANRVQGGLLARQHMEGFFLWATVGVIVGGRLGHILFYDFWAYWAEPWKIGYLWEGGMSFHGGVLGCGLCAWLYSRYHSIYIYHLSDCWLVGVPWGIFFGRIANFINQELYGRPSYGWFSVLFSQDPSGLPRHPSQLYEAILEGPVLFLILVWAMESTKSCPPKRALGGRVTGAFLGAYGLFRWVCEYFREPETLFFLPENAWVTGGQLLTLPLMGWGAYLWFRSLKREASERG